MLEPIGFIIYINDYLKHNSENCLIIACTDDIVVLVFDKNPEILKEEMQADINRFNKWVHDNFLTINSKKKLNVLLYGSYGEKIPS